MAMNVATGALGSLLPMLGELVKEEFKLQTGATKDIESIQRELSSMDVALRKVGEVPRDQLDEQVRHWADEVRELSYDADDMVDAFLVRVAGYQLTEHSCFKRLMEKMANLFKKAKARRKITTAIRDIKTQVLDVAARRDRYRVDSVGTNLPAPTSTVDPRLLSLYKDKKEIVGIQELVNNIIKRLTDGDEKVSNKQLKILSILGPGGLGKTTLAKAVYDRLQWQFVRRSFVSVGRNPDVKKVLKDILLQLAKEKYETNSNMATFDEQQLIDEVRGLLESVRYLIIIDDIWDMTTWEIIRCALVDSNHGSKIITTTRIFEVTTKASDIHKLEPLSHDNSKELFYRRLFGGNEKVPDDKLPEVSEKLLRKCGGVPLAIITIASLLASKPIHDWPKVYNSIGFGSRENENVRNTRKILMFSYYDLPSYLKTCLLHLCTFPEDYLIKKKNLIWKWVAEGFVREESGIGLFELGERYFNELINRSMIQPIQKPAYLGKINGCRVHDMVLDMICSISMEENFVNILDSHGQHTSSHRKARRLAIQKRNVEQDDPLHKVRSFNAIMCDFRVILSLSNFKVLRVLAMENCTLIGRGSWQLENLGRLLQLRFLGLRGTPIRELPEEIGNLMFLQILDLKHTHITGLPQSVGLLRRLKCLYTGLFGVVSDWIGNLTSLQELQFSSYNRSPNLMKELGKLTLLRVLRIKVVVLTSIEKRDLVDSLGKLQSIQVLHVMQQYDLFDEADWEGFVPPRQLLALSVNRLSRLPAWINSSLLPNLYHLYLGVEFVDAEDLKILGRFPELLTLELSSGDYFSFEVIGNGTFPKLRYFYPHCIRSGLVRFLKGAMPSLQSIRLDIKVPDNFDFGGLRNLTSLEEVTVRMNCLGARGLEAEEAKAALRHAIDNHPNRPTLHLSIYIFTPKGLVFTDPDTNLAEYA